MEAKALSFDFEVVSTALPDVLVSVSKTGELLYLNEAFEKITGWTREEWIGRSFIPLVAPEDREQIIRAVERVFQGEPVMADFRVIKKDGSYRTMQGLSRSTVAEGGEVLFGVIRDIEPQSELMEALSEREQRMSAIMNNTFELIGLLDARGFVLEANRAALDFVGISAEEAKGIPLSHSPWFTPPFATEEYHRKICEALPKAVAGQFVRYDTVCKSVTGEERTFDFSLKPVSSSDGIVRFIIPEGRDITEQRKAEQELIQRATALAESNAELEQFAHVLSHDLREPLRMVVSYLSLLDTRNQGKLDATSQEFLKYAKDGAARMGELIHNILKYASVDGKGHSREIVDGREMVELAMKNLEVAIRESGAKIEIGAIPRLRVDRSQCVQLFQNLLSNAIKYTDSTPEISVTASPMGIYCLISVRDNGVGIHPDHFDRIFLLFQQLTPSAGTDGRGIGLATAKKIVRRHCGEIWVESTPGKGSTFRFTLPMA